MLERRFLTGDRDALSAPRLALCNFYGTTALGGAHGGGTVFSFWSSICTRDSPCLDKQ